MLKLIVIKCLNLVCFKANIGILFAVVKVLYVFALTEITVGISHPRLSFVPARLEEEVSSKRR